MDKSEQIKQLEGEIETLCQTLKSLATKEKKAETPQSGIEQVEKDNILRQIRAQKREANESLQEKSSARVKLYDEVETSSTKEKSKADAVESKEPEKQEDCTVQV